MATFDPERFKLAMDKAPERLFAEVTKRLKKRAQEFLFRILRRERLSGRPGLNSPSGRLAGSFDLVDEGDDLKSWRMVEFSTSKYAAIHEHGGVITPRGSKYLAVPLDAAKAAGGDVRGSPRSFTDTFFATSKAGNLILFRNTGRKRPKDLQPEQPDPSIEPLFVMKKEVRIPARLGFFNAWAENQKKRTEDIAKAADVALDGLS